MNAGDPAARPTEGSALPIRPFRGDLDWPVAGRMLTPFGRRGASVVARAGADRRAVRGAGRLARARGARRDGRLCRAVHRLRQSRHRRSRRADHSRSTGSLATPQVERGAKVERGRSVGTAGRILAGIPGMYFEMRVDGKPVDPLEWLKKNTMTSRTRFIAILVSAPVIAFTVIGGLLGHAMARADETYANLRVFHDVVSLIMSNYVEQPNMESVMRGAMRGLAEGLDSDSAYLTQPQVRQIEGGEQPGAGRRRDHADASVLPARRRGARRLARRQGGHPSRRFRSPGRFAAHARHVGVRRAAPARRRRRDRR